MPDQPKPSISYFELLAEYDLQISLYRQSLEWLPSRPRLSASWEHLPDIAAPVPREFPSRALRPHPLRLVP